MKTFHWSWLGRIVAGSLLALAVSSSCFGAASSTAISTTGSYTASIPSPDDLTTTGGSNLQVTGGTAQALQPEADGEVSLDTTETSGACAVFTGRLTGWGCFYAVEGVWTGGGGTVGGTATKWHSWFDNDNTACITLEVNGPGPDDNYVGLGGTGTLTVTVQNGVSGTYYIVDLSCSSNDTPAGNVTFSSPSVTVAGGGDSQTVIITGDAIGELMITGTATNAATGTVAATAVQLARVAVVGATRVTKSEENYAAVKSATGNVVIQAFLKPDVTPTAPADLVTWSGGTTVQGQMLQRAVPLATSAETQVSVRCGGKRGHANVWVVWASLDVQVKAADTVSVLNDAAFVMPGHGFPPEWGGGINLGPISCEDTTLTKAYTAGRMQAEATLEPLGVGRIMPTQWKMRRSHNVIAWDNGGNYTLGVGGFWHRGPSKSTGGFVDDTSDPRCQSLDGTWGTIFDVDCPGCSLVLPGTAINHTSEVYNSFDQYVAVTLGGAPVTCSDHVFWSYLARVDVDKAAKPVEANVLDTWNPPSTSFKLPAKPHYTPRFNISGRVTQDGNGLAGVVVTAGKRSATTAANGSYTIVGVEVGTGILVKPSKGETTFAPASATVTLADEDVSSQNFTAN